MRNRLGGLVAALALLATLTAAAPAAAATYPAGFEERTLASGLTATVGADWTPDGRMLVIEKWGALKVVRPGQTTGTTILDISSRVNAYHDRGLLGIAVDSDFASNGFIYLLYTYELNQLQPDGSGRMVSRLERFKLNPDNTVTNGTVLLGSHGSGDCPAPSNTVDCIPSEGLSHSIGSVRSAPDGTLFVGSGDAASFSSVDSLAFRTYDERSMAGKILRIDRNGRGLPSHPFCPTNANLDHVCTKVWAKGFRNPYRFKMRPGGGLTVGDVGWNTREELQLIDPSEGGRSWGWPCYEGTIRTPGYRDRSECSAEFAKEGTAGAHTPPDHDYAHNGSSSSVLGGPTYLGDLYPSGHRNDVFFADYSAGFIKRADVDSQGRITAINSFATGWSGTDLTVGPNGNLVMVSYGTGAPGTGSVREIAYSPGNATPVAVATADKTSGSAPLTVAFSSNGTRDADNDPLTYEWDFGDGSPLSTAANPTHTYTRTGNFTARLTVRDGRGRQDTATVAIAVGNSAPVPVIDEPADGRLYDGGETIALRGSATDPQDGALPSSAISWRVVLHHGNHTHPYTEMTGAQASFRVQEDHDADSHYAVTMTARDAGGLTASKTVTLRPRTINLRFASVPAGAPITYSGLTATPAPFERSAAVGYRTTVSAVDEFTAADGERYVFDSWSDGGARSHDLSVPAASTTLTATYRKATAPPPPNGLVGAWGFDEASGTAVRDASGRGNDGTISGAARATTGRHGAALSFDGVNDWVTVPDSSSLDLTGPMTLEAWVKPDVNQSWDTILMKEFGSYYTYALYGTSEGAWPSGWARDAVAWGNAPLSTSRWTHLAFTYDRQTARLYVDGTLVSSYSAAFTLPNADGPLRFGGNGIWANEWFDGSLDEIRIYDRPLSQAEVQRDMTTPVGGGTPPPADTTPPTVAITAPADLARVSGTVPIAANASDNAAVESVTFRVDGQPIGTADTSAPYSASWDTRGLPNGARTLTAVARDAAGNTTTSAPVRVQVDNPTGTPDGLVGAWSFDETTGTTVRDASGRGNDGTISGAARMATGRHGGALSFDGVNDWVTVPDSSSLDLTGPMTLQAWVRPDVNQTWDTVLMKEFGTYYSYALYTSSEGAWPSGWARDAVAWGNGPVSTSRWTHLAFTYDGLTARLYVDGALVSTFNSAFALPNTNGPLRIGGNGIWANEWFDGLIDEVRIYDKPLTAAQVQADMATGVGSTSQTPAAAPTGSAAPRSAGLVRDARTAGTVPGPVTQRHGAPASRRGGGVRTGQGTTGKRVKKPRRRAVKRCRSRRASQGRVGSRAARKAKRSCRRARGGRRQR